jgi:hypothetical protein
MSVDTTSRAQLAKAAAHSAGEVRGGSAQAGEAVRTAGTATTAPRTTGELDVATTDVQARRPLNESSSYRRSGLGRHSFKVTDVGCPPRPADLSPSVPAVVGRDGPDHAPILRPRVVGESVDDGFVALDDAREGGSEDDSWPVLEALGMGVDLAPDPLER